jgi:hypothetical protein
MPASAVVTVRIDPELLAALKERAKRDGRSVSAEVIWMLRKEIEALPRKPPTRRPTMGMFADFDAPDASELKKLRRKFSAELQASARRREHRT